MDRIQWKSAGVLFTTHERKAEQLMNGLKLLKEDETWRAVVSIVLAASACVAFAMGAIASVAVFVWKRGQ